MKDLISKYLFSPSSNINYNFIASTYAFFSALSILLYFLETQVFISAEYQEERGNSMLKELAESTKGLYMIFIPFLPALLWSLIVRQIWKGGQSQQQQVDQKKKDD